LPETERRTSKEFFIFAKVISRDEDMTKRIQLTAPNQIQATIQLPSSKSICNRALIIRALAQSHAPIENLSDCDDTRVMVKALQEMKPVIDIMAAGTAMRFLTAYLSVTEGSHLITGTERMKQRPIRILVDALRSLGAQIEYAGNEGFPPLKITGTELTQSEISLPGNVSSQYISALLMIGPVLKKGLRLTLTGEIISRPYIDLTLQLMNRNGADAGWTGPNILEVKPQPYQPTPYYIESDWSAASYWYAFAALTPQATLRLPDLYQDSLQGDARVAELFSRLGVSTTYHEKYVELTRTSACVEELTNDFTNQPDLAQTFVVTCALLGIRFRFSGLQSLKIKETDRMAALIKEMKKLGYLLREEAGSVLIWDGERCEPDACPAIDTYEDHRMAMAFAPACFKFKGLQINEPQVVSKSYPDFWKDLQTAGFQITEA
jgi:3-phosphoshikimate 1-carboxyvinyltransferase